MLALLAVVSCSTVSNAYVELALEYYDLGQQYELLDEQQDKAISQYKTALEFYPVFEEAAFSLAILYVENNEFQLAQEVLDGLLGNFIAFDNRLESLQAYLALAQSDYEGAEEIYLQHITEDDAGYDTYYNLGLLYRKTERETEATEMFNRALEARPDFIQAHEQIAYSAFQEMNYPDVVVRLSPYIDSIAEFLSAALMLGDSLIETENYAELFTLVENLHEAYENGADLSDNFLPRYRELFLNAARGLAEIAIDDERSLQYFMIVGEMNFLSANEWDNVYSALEDIKGLDMTIEFIAEQYDAEALALEAERAEKFIRNQIP